MQHPNKTLISSAIISKYTFHEIGKDAKNGLKFVSTKGKKRTQAFRTWLFFKLAQNLTQQPASCRMIWYSSCIMEISSQKTNISFSHHSFF